jgi:tetratricopeptide (TPR) repeat protein
MLGKTLGGRYQITRHLGGGGFGQTYLAEDLHLPGNPPCVVKQLKPKVTNSEALQTARRLFDTEAQVLYTLGNHDQIPRLFAHFEECSDFYLVQEFIAGDILSQELKTHQALAETDVISLLLDLLTVLEFVHQQQVIHRDIKPSNLIRRAGDRRMILIDFGAVKQIEEQAYESTESASVTIAVGSSGYMPNEQLAGKPHFSSDIYAVGMLAIQCLTGIYPKQLPSDPRTSEILWRDRAQVSPEVADILDTMVRYDFRQRYPSAKEALASLQALVSVVPVSTLLAEPVLVSFDGHLAWLERGDDLFQLQRYKDAVTAYDRVVQVKPEDDQVWFKRGLALENLHHYEDAVASYDRVVQLQPQDYLAWYKRGTALEQLQRYEEALQSYEQVVQLQPENYWAWHDRGSVLEHLQQQDEAIASYDRAVQLKPDFQLAVDSRKRVLSQLRRVDTLYHLQHYDEAVASCDRAIQNDPKDSLAWLMRGMALENLQRDEEALVAYNRVVTLQPEDDLAWFKRATVLEKLNRPEEAIASYHKVVQIQPDNAWAWYDRGRLLEAVQKDEEAIGCYDRAVQLKPDLQVATEARQRMLGQLRIRSSPEDDEDETIVSASLSVSSDDEINSYEIDTQAIKEVVHEYKRRLQQQQEPTNELTEPLSAQAQPDLRPSHPPMPYPTSQAVNLLGSRIVSDFPAELEEDKTFGILTQAANQSEQDNYRNWCQKGRALENAQRYAEALVAYERASQIRSDVPDLWHWHGNVLCTLRRYEEAIASYERALQLQPDNADLWCHQGGALVRLKQLDDAIASFDRAIQLKPSNHSPWYWRGRLLCELKRYEEAVRCFEQALELQPNFQPAIRDRQLVQDHLNAQPKH